MQTNNRIKLGIRVVASILAASIAILGIVVITGWYSENEALLRVIPDAVAMQYNTALGFLISGITMLMLIWGKRRIPMALSVLLFALGFLTGMEYVLGINLGIDEIFMDHYISDQVTFKGRMAPNSALCFLLSGLMYYFFSLREDIRKGLFFVGLLSFTIFLLGTLAFIGYFIDLGAVYSWAGYTVMAIHTTVGFITTGIASFLGLWFVNGGQDWIESSISRRLMIYLMVPILSLYLIMATYSIYKVKESIYKEAYMELNEICWKQTSIIDKRMGRFEEIARASERFVLTQTSLLEEEVFSVLTSDLEAHETLHGAAIVFAPYKFEEQRKLFAPYAYRDDGKIERIDFGVEGYDYADGEHPWYEIPKNEKREFWTEPYLDFGFNNKMMSTYSVPIFDEEEFIGVAIVDIPLENISVVFDLEELSNVAYGIISSQGNYIYRSYGDNNLDENVYEMEDSRGIDSTSRKEWADAMLSGNSGIYPVELANGETFYSVYNPIGNTGWTFFVGRNGIYKPLRDVINQLSYWFLLISGLFVLVIYIVSRRLSKRVEQLSAATSEIGSGHLVEMSSQHSNDEIGVLAQNFSKMNKELMARERDLNNVNERLEEKVKLRTAELAKAVDAADEANRSKSVFLANMSHEIRTPMNAVLGFSELLERMVKTDIEKSYLNSIISSGKNLLTLINDILDLSKIEAGKIDIVNSFFDIRVMLEEIRSTFSLKVKEKGLNFFIDVDNAIPRYVYLDEDRFRQVMINLISNAIKFTESGYVRVVVKLDELIEEDSLVDFTVAVEDTGIGIKEEFKKNLFETFTQQDGKINKRFGGTGLGLSISKNLIELMGGTIKAASEAGKGAKFSVVFSDVVYNNSIQATEDLQIVNFDNIKFEKSTILIVDDIEANRNYLRGALLGFKFELIECEDGIQVMDTLKEHGLEIDLIITDLRMPNMDGFEMIQKIRASKDFGKIPIIATSASVMEFNVEKAKRHHFDDFLSKPVGVNNLIKSLIKFIPSNFKDLNLDVSEEQFEVEKTYEFTGDTEKLLPILDTLEAENKNLKERQSMSEIEAFSDKLLEVGEEFQLKGFLDYGKGLKKAVDSFNVEKMLILINGFGDYVKEIRKEIS